MASEGWKEHILLDSYVGGLEDHRPTFIGPSPPLAARRSYIREYLSWMIGTTETWENHRRAVERLIAGTLVRAGCDIVGEHYFEYAVDETLWGWSFQYSGHNNVPAFPWKEPSRTDGEPSETYMAFRRARAWIDHA
ncbi:hypothetical protein NW752_003071 [Fusarium irregulare]|uniref:Uncharacterized protein n=1 Tax=Fusarium irregulare TaxID=2494466 RepID=A0A9W8UG13_9HYPO|nr:hypothetical protein NW766_000739 [Fusarium irregulare]KAJ4025598.1 hypothetical protein NW752_003071 [Fusarium irregulare]